MISDRINKLVQKTVKGDMYVKPQKTTYEHTDHFLSSTKLSAKRVCEYILNQEPLITEDSMFCGNISFDSSVEGDIFNRQGFPSFKILCNEFYNKPINNLLTFEWQHSVGNFGKIINIGLIGVLEEIDKSRKSHEHNENALEFLQTQTDFVNTVIAYAKKCSKRALDFADTVEDNEKKENLLKLANGLKRVPENPAASFYEAVLSLYFVYGYIPDSIGLIDRYLRPYFENDIKNGVITNDEAKEYLQELFLMLQARIHISSDRFYRGGETHFCVGGYNERGEDSFSEFSKLIVDSLLELPTWIPQISLRWTKKTPRAVFEYMMKAERSDKNKRIAFVNDEPRIKGLMKYSGFSYNEAVNYTMMGCNELAMPGGMVLGFDPFNIARSLQSTFVKRKQDILNAESFDDFFNIYKQELFSDLDEADEIGSKIEAIRRKDNCTVSNIFIDGCIDNAKPVSMGGGNKYIAVGLPIGITTVIDSLSVVKQFVYEKKSLSMSILCSALENNWQGYENLRAMILKNASFFGNDHTLSNGVSQMLTSALAEWNTGNNYLKKPLLFGNLIGYNEHNKFFGQKLMATPDGRYAGEPISFGIGQSDGKDRCGVTALLNSVAKCDPECVLTGPSVTNLLVDEQLVKNDESFEKLISLFEAYFMQGGTHFQLNYMSRQDLLNAKKEPEKHRSLRVRVSGFSDYFVFLNDALQDEIITRTEHKH